MTEKTEEHTEIPPSIDYQSLTLLSVGGAGIVYAIDEDRVLKEYHERTMDVEFRALRRLGSHVNIVKCLAALENGLILERGRCLRTIIQDRSVDWICLRKRFEWLLQAARGTAYMHEKGIIHADVGLHNWIIVGDQLKIIDFEGCSIDGEEAAACYEWFSYKTSTPSISYRTDIFAFGCAIYEIMRRKHPHYEIAGSDDKMRLSRERYAADRFPDVKIMPLSGVVKSCWNGTFSSMSEVVEELESVLDV